jgi:hypothetical protein
MSAWRRYFELRIEAKTGLTPGVLFSAAVMMCSAILTFAFCIVAGYLALADRYGPLNAALMLAAGFFLIATLALLGCQTLQRRAKERAQLALAAHQPAPWLDPRLLGIILQANRLDRRVLVALLAIPLVAGAGLHWYGNHRLPGGIPPE